MISATVDIINSNIVKPFGPFENRQEAESLVFTLASAGAISATICEVSVKVTVEEVKSDSIKSRVEDLISKLDAILVETMDLQRFN